MSVICIVRKNGVSAIAADSMTTEGTLRRHARFTTEASKIIRAGDSMLGMVGYCAHQFVLRDLVGKEPELFCFSGRKRIFRSLRKLHKVLKKKYHLQTEEWGGQPYESSQMNFCIANAGGIYEVDSYREVFEVQRFWAIGSGSRYALGAMHGCFDRSGLGAREVAEIGVRAAVEFDLYCGKPIECHALPKARRARAGQKA